MNEARIRAPELPAELEWFNTERPIRLSEQRGKVVLLDFWTYCCINCMHILPDLRYLEDKYGDSLCVIGIHSPKFPNERVGEQVRKAIARYHIRHPVAHDPAFRVWRTYGIRAWPSVLFIDPEGYVVGVLPGEGRRRQLDALIQQHLEAAERKGILNPEPLPLRRERLGGGVLSFPGKVVAAGERLFVSDSGRNRVLELNAHGRVVRIFGSGTPGLVDGAETEAAFCEPQGLAAVGDYVYVADRGNHAIRRIDRVSAEVHTVAGTGRQGRVPGAPSDRPLEVPLNSPWDLAHHEGVLYIAMAGQHQIWRLDLARNVIARLSGSGREDLVDGPAEQAAFAQPSGLAAGMAWLYVADSESSAIRRVRYSDGLVETLVGQGLFEFGDRDGVGREARLQHPLGLAYDGRRDCLWIADTYNHKVRKLDLRTRTLTTLPVGCTLDEPGGISWDGRRLWVANTNRHEIVRVAPDSGECAALEVVVPEVDLLP